MADFRDALREQDKGMREFIHRELNTAKNELLEGMTSAHRMLASDTSKSFRAVWDIVAELKRGKEAGLSDWKALSERTLQALETLQDGQKDVDLSGVLASVDGVRKQLGSLGASADALRHHYRPDFDEVLAAIREGRLELDGARKRLDALDASWAAARSQQAPVLDEALAAVKEMKNTFETLHAVKARQKDMDLAGVLASVEGVRKQLDSLDACWGTAVHHARPKFDEVLAAVRESRLDVVQALRARDPEIGAAIRDSRAGDFQRISDLLQQCTIDVDTTQIVAAVQTRELRSASQAGDILEELKDLRRQTDPALLRNSVEEVVRDEVGRLAASRAALAEALAAHEQRRAGAETDLRLGLEAKLGRVLPLLEAQHLEVVALLHRAAPGADLRARGGP